MHDPTLPPPTAPLQLDAGTDRYSRAGRCWHGDEFEALTGAERFRARIYACCKTEAVLILPDGSEVEEKTHGGSDARRAHNQTRAIARALRMSKPLRVVVP